jgi:hypothetical protein
VAKREEIYYNIVYPTPVTPCRSLFRCTSQPTTFPFSAIYDGHLDSTKRGSREAVRAEGNMMN